MAISQGMDWQVAMRPLWEVSYFAVAGLQWGPPGVCSEEGEGVWTHTTVITSQLNHSHATDGLARASSLPCSLWMTRDDRTSPTDDLFLGDRGSISQKWAPRTVCFCSAEPFCAEIKWTPSSPLLFKWQLCVAAAVSKLQIACPQCLLAPDRCTLSPPGFSLMLTGLICWGLRNAALCGLLKSGTPFWIHVMVLLGPLLETQTNLGC